MGRIDYHRNLTGLVNVEPTSKTSYQCVETELNEGLGRRDLGSCRTTHFSFRDPAAAANLTVEISADGGGVTGGTETSISHAFTGAASEEEHVVRRERRDGVPAGGGADHRRPDRGAVAGADPGATRVLTTPPSSAPAAAHARAATTHDRAHGFPTLDCPADAPLLLTFRYLPRAAGRVAEDPDSRDRDGRVGCRSAQAAGRRRPTWSSSASTTPSAASRRVQLEHARRPVRRPGLRGGDARRGRVHRFRPNLDDWKFPFCIEDGNLIKNPTAPTIVIPTAVPTSPPSIRPTATACRRRRRRRAARSRPSATPTTPPSSVPTTPPSIRPTATPTTPPSSAPTTPPSHAPTPAPTRTPTAVPTSIPTSYPSVACDGENDEGNGYFFRTSERFLPDGASWETVTTTVTRDDGLVLSTVTGARPDRDYGCTEERDGCFVVKFVFGDPTISSSLTYEFMTYVRSDDPTDYDLISTSFPPNLQTGSYTFCVEGRRLAREPTPAPTVSSVPTSVPTVPPSRTPTAGPTVPPTPDPTLAPSPLPSFAPTLQPSPAPSTTPTALPTPVPSAACSAPTADWIRVSTRYFPAAADWGGVTITQTLLDGTRRRLGDGRLLQTGGAAAGDGPDRRDHLRRRRRAGSRTPWPPRRRTATTRRGTRPRSRTWRSCSALRAFVYHDHTNAPNFSEDISGWDVSQVTSMEKMFSGRPR